MTKDANQAPDLEGPLGTKRHVGRTGPRVDPSAPLSTLIRFARESVPMSRPQLYRHLKALDPAGVGVSVASIHTLEHERAPRDGELDLLLPALKALIGDAKWVEFGGSEFIPVKPVKAPRKRAPKAAKVVTPEIVEPDVEEVESAA